MAMPPLLQRIENLKKSVFGTGNEDPWDDYSLRQHGKYSM